MMWKQEKSWHPSSQWPCVIREVFLLAVNVKWTSTLPSPTKRKRKSANYCVWWKATHNHLFSMQNYLRKPMNGSSSHISNPVIMTKNYPPGENYRGQPRVRDNSFSARIHFSLSSTPHIWKTNSKFPGSLRCLLLNLNPTDRSHYLTIHHQGKSLLSSHCEDTSLCPAPPANICTRWG